MSEFQSRGRSAARSALDRTARRKVARRSPRSRPARRQPTGRRRSPSSGRADRPGPSSGRARSLLRTPRSEIARRADDVVDRHAGRREDRAQVGPDQLELIVERRSGCAIRIETDRPGDEHEAVRLTGPPSRECSRQSVQTRLSSGCGGPSPSDRLASQEAGPPARADHAPARPRRTESPMTAPRWTAPGFLANTATRATEHVVGHVEGRLAAARVYWIATVSAEAPRVRPVDGHYHRRRPLRRR